MGLSVRTIGIARAEAKITLANLAYNIDRLIFHERRAAVKWVRPAKALSARKRPDRLPSNRKRSATLGCHAPTRASGTLMWAPQFNPLGLSLENSPPESRISERRRREPITLARGEHRLC
jgi:hypothetical protein